MGRVVFARLLFGESLDSETLLHTIVDSKESDKYRISALELLSRSVEEIGKPHVIVNIR